MEIKLNNLYLNKTWRFLIPCLKGHGAAFIERFDPLFKLAVGVGDSFLEKAPVLEDKKPLFIMIDKEFNKTQVTYFLNWVQYQSYFITEYCPCPEIETSRRHMIVIAVPKIYNDAYDHFLKGRYSKMYSENDIEFLFSSQFRIKEKEILSQTSTALKEHLDNVKKEFGSIPNGSKHIPEYELPPKKKEEVFFYTEKKVYF